MRKKFLNSIFAIETFILISLTKSNINQSYNMCGRVGEGSPTKPEDCYEDKSIKRGHCCYTEFYAMENKERLIEEFDDSNTSSIQRLKERDKDNDDNDKKIVYRSCFLVEKFGKDEISKAETVANEHKFSLKIICSSKYIISSLSIILINFLII